MRHVLAAVAIRLRSRGVVQASIATALVSMPSLTLLAPASRRRALARAVPLAAIAAAADEEDLPAIGAVADDEAQRVHGSGRDRQELDVAPVPCDEHLVDPGSGRTT